MIEKTHTTNSEHDDAEMMLAAYRHDAHKITGQPHAAAPDTFAGVRVNQTVPYGADRDASVLSRPSKQPEPTVEAHTTNYRLSLIDGESQDDAKRATHRDIEAAIHNLLTEDDPEVMHQKWLDSDIISAFNESVYYPYTSLKYHTLLVAALLDNYRNGHEFEELLLVVDSADEVVPHRTIYADEYFTLRIDEDAAGRPSARLGSQPWRSWASTWSRVTAHRLDTDHDKYEMVLDANLRRIGAWSTALQYLEDFREVFDR